MREELCTLQKDIISSKKPMTEGGAFQKFTELEKENIRAGVVKEGMSKDDKVYDDSKH